jgi:broad specificity phosphatase PhoE
MPTPRWPAQLWLVRHGESAGNVADRQAHDSRSGRIQLEHRDADVELSPLGERQAKALGAWMTGVPENERPTVVISSPYERARATAQAIVDGGLDVPMRLDERLRERDLGVLDGLTGLGVREQYPEEAERRAYLGKFYYRPPSGESWADVALRVRSLVDGLRQEPPDSRVLLATHQAVIMVFRYVVENLTEREILDIDGKVQIANCSVTRYVPGSDDTLTLVTFNDAEPIEELGEAVTEEPDTAKTPDDSVQ